MKNDVECGQEMWTEMGRPDCPSYCLSNSGFGGQNRVGIWEFQAIISSTLCHLAASSSSCPLLPELLSTPAHRGSPGSPEAQGAGLLCQWATLSHITPFRPDPAQPLDVKFQLKLWEPLRAAEFGASSPPTWKVTVKNSWGLYAVQKEPQRGEANLWV